MKDKLALIIGGGGMTCSFGVGCVLALVKEYGLTAPDIVIAGSGGAGTAAYYVAGQYQSILNIWENLLSTKKFINVLRFWRVIDIDYLIDTVFRKQDPLRKERVQETKTVFLIPVTNACTGELEYLSAKNGDIFEALRATKAMPLAYNKLIPINHNVYCDSYLSSPPGLHIGKAIEMGARKILVIENGCYNPVINLGYGFWARLRSNRFKNNHSNLLEKAKKIEIPEGVEVFRIKPMTKLRISTLNNNRKLLIETIEKGYNECKENTKLREFLNNDQHRQLLAKSDS